MAVRQLSRYGSATPEAADVYGQAAESLTDYTRSQSKYKRALKEGTGQLKEELREQGTEGGALSGLQAGSGSGAAIGAALGASGGPLAFLTVPVAALIGAVIGGGVGAGAGAGGGSLTGHARARDVDEAEVIASNRSVRDAKKEMIRQKAAMAMAEAETQERERPRLTRTGREITPAKGSTRIHQPGRMIT